MSDATSLLLQWNDGDPQARDALLQQVYAELSAIAGSQLAGESRQVELEPSALVHEAYLRLIDMNRIDWQNRAHFLAVAARVMRQILIDHARKRSAIKRDGGVRVTMSGLALGKNEPKTDVLMLHAALEKLARLDPDRAQLVELRFFGGLTFEEAALVVGTSSRTIKRSWAVARGWLYREMNSPAAVPGPMSDG